MKTKSDAAGLNLVADGRRKEREAQIGSSPEARDVQVD